MEVILTEDYISLGFVGDKVKVRSGYARNYLIPRGLAVPATSRDAKQLRHQLGIINAKKLKLKKAAEEIASRVQGLILEFTLKIGERGKSYGSITTKEIELALREKGYSFERKQIKLNEPIKGAGEYEVDLKIHAEVSTRLLVRVISEKPVVADSEKESETKVVRGAKTKARKTSSVRSKEDNSDLTESDAGESMGEAKTTKSKKEAKSRSNTGRAKGAVASDKDDV
ncbi:MAG TPA: 50S ribosomal protein L9 [Oligoflexia bacterium]|nr:50S ribosomal protein L9 [Oligoflexia bacterium]HMP26740.1 50S ribosomal protein L9 [Oligoflexia bacterium]